MSDSSATVPGGGSIVAEPNAATLASSFATFSVVSVIGPGQTVDEPTVNGGFITIDAGGTGVFTKMNGGFVSTFGTAEGGSLGGGFIEVFGGGLATHWKTDGGIIEVFTGGVASGDVIGSIEEVGEVSSGGGTAINEVIKSIQDVVNGGVASHTTVDASGFQDVSAGGIARATAVKKDGIETVVAGGVASGTILSSGGELVISSGGSASLTTVKQGATIDLAAVPFVSGATASLNAKTDVLTVKDGGTTVSLKLAGKYTGEKFRVSKNTTSANSGSTNITVACFAAGTLIATARGEVPVEALSIGDRVATLGGGERPVVWVGQRRLDCRTHPHPELVWPIRIQAGAFGAEKPRRDLVLSPGHSVYCDGVLVPVEHLISGATVAQERWPSVHYFHLELERHDIVLAENLPAESYLDDGNRGAFENGTLHPDFIARSWDDACAPRCTEGAAPLAARRLLHDRALALGWSIEAEPDLRLFADEIAVPPAAVVPLGGKFVRRRGTLYRYTVPPGARTVRLVSGPGVPAWLDPAAADQRRLGSRISAVYLDERPVPLSSKRLAAGFYPVERLGGERWRWTDGDARLDLPASAQPRSLDLFLQDAMRRWRAPAGAAARMLA